MVVIKEIKRGKKKYTLTMANGNTFDVNVDVALSYSVHEGEMEEERFKELLKESDRQNAKVYLYSMISRKPRTVKESRDRLYEKGYHKDAVEYAIKTLSSYGYLDDADYAKNFVENGSRNKGGYRLRREMQLKGVSEEDINLALGDLDEEGEFESGKALAKKHLRGGDLRDEKVKEKLFRYLLARGYSYGVVKKILRELGVEIEEN